MRHIGRFPVTRKKLGKPDSVYAFSSSPSSDNLKGLSFSWSSCDKNFVRELWGPTNLKQWYDSNREKHIRDIQSYPVANMTTSASNVDPSSKIIPSDVNSLIDPDFNLIFLSIISWLAPTSQKPFKGNSMTNSWTAYRCKTRLIVSKLESQNLHCQIRGWFWIRHSLKHHRKVYRKKNTVIKIAL